MFDVSEEMLGMPLAKPRARLIAIVIDLAVIGFVTLVTSSFALILGVVAAIFFMRAGFKRTPVRRSVFNRAMRFSVGCLGLFIGLVTAAAWWLFGASIGNDTSVNVADVTASLEVEGVPLSSLMGAVSTLTSGADLADADDLEEAEEEYRGLVEDATELGVPPAELRNLMLALTPADADWAPLAEDLIDRILAETDARPEEALEASMSAEIDAYSLDDALVEYGVLRRAGAADESSRARLGALASRLTAEVAADSLGALEARIEDLEDDVQDRNAALQASRAQLTAATSGGLFNRLRDLVDELGFGFGWASLYLTIFLSWWDGRTVGKRLMGIRVRRLDGEPITWWVAFERAGGYAAGFATGLLGFAQVYWDANRQAIHDRIVGTVVVVDGAPRVSDWESAT